MDKKIELGKNRDWANLWLDHINDDIYKINCDKQYVINYGRYSIDDNDNIIYFDPSGGPMIYSGSSIRDVNNYKYMVNKIFIDDFNRVCFKLTKLN